MAAMDSSDNGASSSDSNSGSFKATGRGRCRALRIFWEYPDLAKTTIGAGFLIACLLIGTPLVLNELKVQVWKKNMSSYGAAVQLLSGVVAVAFGGMFGRVSDRIDRRCAFCLCGLLVFMPWYALLLLPKNSTALYAWSALTIVSGATCMTISGCPMINTFVCDVAPVKERELAFGVATALAFAWTILCWVGAGAIAKQYPGEKEPILWYIFFLSLAFYFSICSVRLKGKLLFSCCDRRAKDLPSCSENEVSDSEDEETGPDLVTQSTLASDMSGVSCKREATGTHTDFAPSYSLIAPFRLACQIPSLRNACLTAGLLALPEVALVDVTMQYYYTELGILEDAAKQQMVSGTNLVVGLTSLLPAYALAGCAAQRFSALTVVRGLIPLVAVLQTFPVLLIFVREIWTIPLLGASQSLATIIFTPLSMLVAEIAPPGRVGESLAAVGVSKQLASFIANLLVFLVSPHLSSYWPFFPASAVLTMSSLFFACRIPRKVKRKATASSLGRIPETSATF